MSRTGLDPNSVLETGKLPANLLARLISTYGRTNDPTVLVPPGPGYDAAVVRPDGDIIVKSDPVTFATSSPAAYLVAVNANDVACLGGIPRWIAVTALFPEGTTEGEVEMLFQELAAVCARDHITVVGGHSEVTSGIDQVLLCGTLIGTSGPDGILRPGGARAEDDLYLTRSAGIEGASILVTELPVTAWAHVPPETIDAARSFIHDPGISVVSEARLAQANGATAMHDPTEGGVSTAIHELADASSFGVEVILERIPVADPTRSICTALDISPYGLLSSGALLFTADPAARGALKSAFSGAGVPLSRIGRMHTDSRRRIAIRDGTEVALPRYDADEIVRAFARFAHE